MLWHRLRRLSLTSTKMTLATHQNPRDRPLVLIVFFGDDTLEFAQIPAIPAVGRVKIDGVERDLLLAHIDEAWADHLAHVADLREGIHLVNAGPPNIFGSRDEPLEVVHRAIVEAFDRLPTDVEDRVAASFRECEVGPEGLDLGRSGLRRPTATWTYLVDDDPFGTAVERLVSRIRKAVKGG
mgnify:CR=1 FL=1